MSEVSRFVIKKGFDLKLKGAPSNTVEKLPKSDLVAVHAKVYKGIKPRLKIKEGDTVKKGSILFENKAQEAFKVLSPISGVVKEIVLGPRRSLEKIIIERNSANDEATFKKYNSAGLAKTNREEVVSHLFATGLIALIQERPFSKIPDIENKPKSVFVNGMNTGPFQPSLSVAINGQEEYFKIGLEVLGRLTTGDVNLCLSDTALRNHELPDALTKASGCKIHYFSGPHPSGNTSIHIDRVDPLANGEHIWTVKGVDLIQIGQLFATGSYPVEKIFFLGGEGVKESARKYYQAELGTDLDALFKNSLSSGDQRIISGDVLSGAKMDGHLYLSFVDKGFTVIPESSHREFLGWLSPGLNKLSATRSFVAGLLGGKNEWSLNTNKHGSLRALVATGWYDRMLPMDIYTDVLVKAVLANDFDLAVKLGILETDPEDFGLCTFVCASKFEIQSVIQHGLDTIEKEGV